MRKKLFTFLLAIVASIGTMFASDIQVNGIWYNFDSSTQTAEVTYHGSSSNTYSNEYTGAITVPTSVLYNGVTYTVTSIGDYAFYLCSDLTSIEIPNSVTRIGASAFNRCSGLTSMDIPNSVTSIGAYVFYLCSGLTSMSIGNSVTTISSHAFDECSALASVMIPTSVANIEEGAFRNCSALTTIDIPNSVTSIGESAFRSCTGLTSIAIPNSVTTIGNGAFAGCWVLSSIEIPNSLTSIGESAFSGCRVITSITNYATMPQVINASTFNDLNKYACTLYVPAESVEAYQTADVWKEFPHIQAIDSTEESDYISVAQALEIGATLDANASTDTTYTIRGYVSFITTPFSEQYLDQTFYIADDSLSTASSNAEGGFYVYCGKPITGQPIKEGALVELTTAIKNYKNRTIENAEQNVPVTVIQEGTCRIYSGTCGAQGDNITWIFNKCDGILTISGTGAMDDYTSYSATPWSSNRAFIKFVIIEDGVTSIGSSAFDGCRGLTSVTIPNSVTSIGDYAFYNCSVLTSITNYAIEPQTINANVFNNIDKSACTLYVPAESVEAYKAAEVWKEFGNIVAIEGDTPEPCIIASGTCGAEGDNLTWTLSCDSVLTISGTGVMADYEWNKAPWFSNAANIVSVEISDGITSIGDYAFNHCSKISSVSIPSGVTSIGFGAFNQCFGLTSVNMPNTLISIGESAFVLDTSLTSITIPSSVTYIGNWAFENHASKITSIICEAVNPPVLAASAYNEPEVFLGIDKSIPLYVPAESIELYRTAAGWKEFGNIVAIGSEPEESNYATIADIYNMAADSAFTLGAFDVVYVPSFQNGSNMYIKDSTGSGVIYMPNYGLQAGDHVEAGLQGKVSIYHGLHEIAPVSTKEELTITSGEAPAPMEATEVPSAANVNQYVIYKGVSFSTDTAFVEGKRHAVNGIWNGHTITFYNQYYMSATLSAGKTYNIIAVNTIYGTIPQAYPLAVEEVSSDTPDSCVIASGTCGAEGDNLTWTLTCDSVLIISGTGRMANYVLTNSKSPAPWYTYHTAIKSVVIEDGVTSIGKNAFSECDMALVMMSGSVSAIADYAFSSCKKIISVDVAIDNQNYCSVDGILFNKNKTTLILYPAAKSDTSYSIPESVTRIGTASFEYCDSLSNIHIPNSVISIGRSAFYGSSTLTYIAIPNSVTSIEEGAFIDCRGLTSVTIGNSVTSIVSSAFYNCSSLTTITNYAATPQTISSYVFTNVNISSCTLYVPAESVEAYQAADVWKDFGTILPIGGTTPPQESDREGQSTEGKDFWVTFMQADQDPNNDLVLSLSISSREDCQVMISNPYTGYMENIYVSADQPQKVELYSGNVLLANARTTMANSGKVCYAGYSEQVDTCALRVTATSDISLFATNYKRATFDATNVLPTALLGDEYFIQTYTPSDHAGVSSSQGSHFAIIATEDNTIVDYCPTVMTQRINDVLAKANNGYYLTPEDSALLNYEVGDTLHTPMLMAGQVFYVWTGKKDGETGDLSGTYVKARNGKRIAVFQGNPHTNIPYQVKQRDQLYSQAMPVQSWGSTFALTASAERPSDIIRVMALYDGTEVRINGETVHTFDFTVETKHFWEFEIGPSGTYAQDGSCMLTTSQPVAVHLFLTSQRHHGDSQSNGDPAMLWVSPIEQQMEQVNFVTNNSMNGTISNYLNVVTDRPNSMTLDNISIASYFSPVSGSNTYHYAQIALGSTATAHTLKCNGGRFNAHVYGFTNNESYGYSVGGFIEYLTSHIYINGEPVSPVNDMCVSDTLFMDITTSFDYQSMKLDFGDGTVVYATEEEGIHARHAYDAPGVYQANVVVASNNNRLDSIPIRIIAGPLSLTYEPLNDIYVGDSIFYIYYHSPIQEMQIEEDFTIDRSFNDAALQDGFGHYTTRLNRSFFGIRIPEGARAGVEYAFNVDIHTLCGDYTATIPFVLKARRTGSCGDNLALTWTYDPETKTLTITGDGTLNSNYTFGLEAPLEMEQLIIAEGVTSIGANAFSNMSTLQTMQLPASLKTIGASAFENDINLTAIYNYRERPCLVDATAFNGVNKFDCTLYVLEGSVDMYKSSISDWKDFYYILPIGTTEVTEPVSDVTVEPHDNSATVTWPTSNNAATYTIQITKDGVLFCTLIFNGNGQLTGIAFAPSRDGQAHAPQAIMTANGLQFTVTGLDSNTQYGYNLTAKDANDQTVATYSGSFTTTSEGIATGVEEISSSLQGGDRGRLILRNGQIYILRGEKVYTVTGQEVR